jgi:hypothetical protein
MKIRFLTKVSQHKRFSFYPRYYDERKERIVSLRKKYEQEDNQNEENSLGFERKEMLKQSISDSWKRGKNSHHSDAKANKRVLLIISLILVIGYFIFSGSNNVETIVHTLD